MTICTVVHLQEALISPDWLKMSRGVRPQAQ
jgi:hypothetical protein